MTALTVAEITHGQVRESIAIARSHGEKFFEQIVWQVENEVWTVLGYASWDEMRAAEYAGLGVVAPRADRPELVSRLRAKGLTQKSVADTIGVTDRTVKAYDAASKGSSSLSEDDPPATVTNSRGQQRPASYAKVTETIKTETHIDAATGEVIEPPKQPDQQPAQQKRKPLPDAFWTARYDLVKKAEALHRLTEDDRFPTNRQKVAEANLNDLLRCRDLLQQVIDRFN